jgi:hypothetical protein
LVSQAPSSSGDVLLVPAKEISRRVSEMISNLERELICFFDSGNIQILADIVASNEFKLLDLKSRGIGLRCVTEIVPANMVQCKELMKHFELFHSTALSGSFVIADNQEYLGYLPDDTGNAAVLHVTRKSFVDGQLFLAGVVMDSKAVPAKQRIGEVVRGTGDEFIETIRDPAKTKSLTADLIRSAIYEIAVLFSTKNSFVLAEKEGMLDEIGQASKRGTKVKILVMRDDAVKEISETKLKAPYEGIQVNYLQQFLPTKITTVIIDQSKSLTIEVNDDTRETMEESIGLATYSNSESTVFSNASVFESLWIQSEMDKQNKARQAYFQLFKGFELRDEVYNRRWSSPRKDEEADQEK